MYSPQRPSRAKKWLGVFLTSLGYLVLVLCAAVFWSGDLYYQVLVKIPVCERMAVRGLGAVVLFCALVVAAFVCASIGNRLFPWRERDYWNTKSSDIVTTIVFIGFVLLVLVSWVLGLAFLLTGIIGWLIS